MTRNVVPAEITIVCDFCGLELDKNRENSRLHFDRLRRDKDDRPLARAMVTFDICEPCDLLVSKAINSMISEAYTDGPKA